MSENWYRHEHIRCGKMYAKYDNFVKEYNVFNYSFNNIWNSNFANGWANVYLDLQKMKNAINYCASLLKT